MTPSEKVAAIVEWLRGDPAVLTGPSVRAALAFADVAASWHAVAGSGKLLTPALVSLPHRLRVVAGVDPDELVRRAVAAVEGAGVDPDKGPVGPPTDTDPPGGRGARSVLDAGAATARTPRLAGDRDKASSFALSEREAAVLLSDLLSAEPPHVSAGGGARADRPARRGGEEVLADRPFRRGDRMSLRHTLRAAVRHRSEPPLTLRAAVRQPTVRHAVVFAVDASGSMFDRSRLDAARAAALRLAETLLRQGHRAGLVVFAERPVVVSDLTRDVAALAHRQSVYEPSDATNIESALHVARDLLRRSTRTGDRRQVLVLSDAEPTAHAGGSERRSRPGEGGSLSLFGVHAARHQALVAAARCRRQDVSVSVLCPDRDCDLGFAATLAVAGGGRMRCLHTVGPT